MQQSYILPMWSHCCSSEHPPKSEPMSLRKAFRSWKFSKSFRELKLSDEDQARGGDRRVVRDSNCADSSSSLLSSSWSDMLPELLGEIIRRVEASEDKGPHRKNVVACACPLPDDGVPRLLLDIGSGSGFRTSFRTSISSSQLLPAFSPSNPYGLDQVPWHKDHRWDRNMNFSQFLEFSSCFGSLPRDEWAVLCACAQ
ncbi:hypothetical protein ACFX15_013130 [Malus domestica]